MATKAHCAYCFETLAASFEHRQTLTLAQVQQLWDEYHGEAELAVGDDDVNVDMDGQEEPASRPQGISRLLNATSASSSKSKSNSSSSTLDSTSASSLSSSTAPASKSSSRSSLLSFGQGGSTRQTQESFSLFITWNTMSSSGDKSLRGCIGTFRPEPLESGLREYALTSAFDDERFSPIPKELLPRLQCCVTLLTDFSAPTKDPMDWIIGKHGIRISFTYHGLRLGATYLPDVALEQGWTKEEAIISLMRKAGWSGRKTEWRNVSGLELVRYEGKKVDLSYQEWKDWRDWVKKQGIKAEPLK